MASTTFNRASDARSDSASAMLAQNWWLFTLRGVLGIIFGLTALIFPGPTMLSLVLFFSAYMLVDGVFGIISAVRAIRRKEDRWGLLIFEGLLNIAVGIARFSLAGHHHCCVRLADCRLDDRHRRIDDGGGLPVERRSWPVVDGSGRASVSCLRRAAYYHAVDRSYCAHLVAGSLRTRFWRRAGHILFQASVAAA
jgi:hypothetical protein